MIIGMNGLVYSSWLMAREDKEALSYMNRHFTLSAESLLNGRFQTVITSMFSHARIDHLMANMVTLIFFGLETIQLKGTAFFSKLYFTGGMLGGLGFVAWDLNRLFLHYSRTSELPQNKPQSLMGASAAVYALVTWKILTSPTHMLYIWMVLPVPAALAGIGFLGYDAYYMYKSDGSSTVAHAAHIFGAMVGAAFWFNDRRGDV